MINREFSRKAAMLLASLIVLMCVGMGNVLAYLLDTIGPVENTFTPSAVTTKVEETVNPEQTVKTNVMIANTGDTEAFICAAIVINWADGNGNVYGTTPIAEDDYDMQLNLNDGWVFNTTDGFYYWTKPVAADDETGVLISSVKLADGVTAPQGYALSVEILCSGVQSVPTSAVEAWSNGLYTVSGAGTADAVLVAK